MFRVIDDIREKLAEKGIVAEDMYIEKVADKVMSALIGNGYWEIIDQAIDEYPFPPSLTIEDIKNGHEYRIRKLNGIKPRLQGQKVVVKGVYLQAGEIVVEVQTGHYKGTLFKLYPSDLEKLSEGSAQA
jgi:hypothetical protein